MSLGDQIGASGSVPGMQKPAATPAATPTKNRSSLTTGGSA